MTIVLAFFDENEHPKRGLLLTFDLGQQREREADKAAQEMPNCTCRSESAGSGGSSDRGS